MAGDFSIDISALTRAVRRAPQAANRGAATALADIKDDWVADAVDIAPIAPKLGGNLRQQINGEVYNPGISGHIEVAVPAVRDGFNYAYYIHEQNAGGGSLTYPGAEKKFLDKPAKENLDKWTKWLEDEVKAELRRAGF